MTKKQTVGVIGAGAWGSALAAAARHADNDVILWSRNQRVVNDINNDLINHIYLPDIKLPQGIKATNDISSLFDNADSILLVIPSQNLRQICQQIKPFIGELPLAICAKGVERGTGALMSDITTEILPDAKIAILSGPTFAKEVAKGLPAAVTLAAKDKIAGEKLINAIGSAKFRPYLSDDIIGVEIGGAVKNILAIACGIVTGRRLGDNARAALITRGLSEMARLGIMLGGKIETIMGLSGLGDLSLTCSSPQSRNMSFGIELGQGKSVKDILNTRIAVTEGVFSALSVNELAIKLDIEMPICHAVKQIISDEANIDDSINKLLSRPFSSE